MNKFLSKIVATALFSTIAIYAANGPDWKGTVPGDVNATPVGGSVVGGDVNLTMALNADMQTSAHFDLVFLNGGVADTAQYALCNGDTLAGTYVTARDKDENGLVTAITFEFEDNETVIQKGEVLNVISGSSDDCDAANNVIKIIPYKDSCVKVKSENGQDQSGNVDIDEINSEISDVVISYRPDILVSCTTPTCVISGNEFTPESLAVGVNYRKPQSISFNPDERGVYCDENGTDCSDDVIETDATPCTTYISLKNNTDYNITALDIALNIVNGEATEGMKYVIDVNGTEQEVNLGSTVNIANIELNTSMEQNISVTFYPDNEHPVKPAEVVAEISNLTDASNTFEDVTLDAGVAEFKEGVDTDFTVTYMNRNYKAFAMITAKAETPLTATITDMNGKTVEDVDCGTLSANHTTFIFSDEKEHADTCLVKAADDAGLADAWSVTFHVKAAVDVAAYMDTGNGQRTLTVLYAPVESN